MTQKRFVFVGSGIEDNLTHESYLYNKDGFQDACEAMNELHNEKEDWKSNCLKQVSENSILWNEISILREQGAEPSDAFKKYLDSISTEYEKFWNRKKEKAKEDGVI